MMGTRQQTNKQTQDLYRERCSGTGMIEVLDGCRWWREMVEEALIKWLPRA